MKEMVLNFPFNAWIYLCLHNADSARSKGTALSYHFAQLLFNKATWYNRIFTIVYPKSEKIVIYSMNRLKIIIEPYQRYMLLSHPGTAPYMLRGGGIIKATVLLTMINGLNYSIIYNIILPKVCSCFIYSSCLYPLLSIAKGSSGSLLNICTNI